MACGHLPPETLCKTVPLFFQGDKERDIGRVLSATHVCCTLLGEMHRLSLDFRRKHKLVGRRVGKSRRDDLRGDPSSMLLSNLL